VTSPIAQSLFYALAALMVCMGILAMATKHVLRSAVYLMAVLFFSAGLYLLLGAEFIAGAQVLVYVGGIVVILVFAVMLTRSGELLEDRPPLGRKIAGALGAAAFFACSCYALLSSPLAADKSLPGDVASIAALGKALVDPGSAGYVLPFEVISLLLLGVLIGGSVIARKEN
jgi:NADH-quinone oxidoreductase subunit J